MSLEELNQEIVRVRQLVFSHDKPHTYHQNKKYLEKLEKELRRRKK